MKIGTMDKPVRTYSGGADSGNGLGSGGKRPGGTNPGDEGSAGLEDDDIVRDKSRILTLFLLLVVLMTFGGLIGAYVVIATNNVLEWRPFQLPLPVWISTALIIVSSFTYHLAQDAVHRRDTDASRRYFVLTSAMGGMFIASQLLAWLELVNRGLYVYGNPYAGFFYLFTAIHAVHVLGGIVALGAVTLRTWHSTLDLDEVEYRKGLATSVGWYWHFMGALWLVLFVMLGYFK
ncbi:MAG TPA: cytochrome c oxidase subunit 3 [Pyrinomonadaceae bacterium]|nr:cytochrome c oxidase subunit 3 [Pyrinomonadaceae bacterium]HMP65021.1 cytochrome c oxidase subunit 3 [Pyrinomonadaceae bacterium]